MEEEDVVSSESDWNEPFILYPEDDEFVDFQGEVEPPRKRFHGRPRAARTESLYGDRDPRVDAGTRKRIINARKLSCMGDVHDHPYYRDTLHSNRNGFANSTEKKIHFYSGTDEPIDAESATFNNLCALAIGEADDERASNDVILTDLSLQGYLKLSPESDTAALTCRLYVWVDHQHNHNASALPPEGWLHDEGANTEVVSYVAPYYESRITILYDTTFDMSTTGMHGTGAGGGTTTAGAPDFRTLVNDQGRGSVVQSFQFHKELYLPLDYSGLGLANVDEMASNAVFFGYSCSEALANSLKCTWMARIKYYDHS